jgi:hypothetical protein
VTTDLELPEYLAQVRARVCRRYAEGWSICPGCSPHGMSCTADVHLFGSLISTPPGGWEALPVYRARLQETRCKQCIFLLLLKAIEQGIPGEEVAGWMERPNLDLDGKTPLACIDAGEFEPVLEALWLTSEPGPSS